MSEMLKPTNDLIRNEFFEFYNQYRGNLNNDANYKEIVLNRDFYFTDRVNLLKCKGFFNKMLDKEYKEHVQTVLRDINRNTIYYYDIKNKEYKYMDFFTEDGNKVNDKTEYYKFLNLFNTCIHTYFPKLPKLLNKESGTDISKTDVHTINIGISEHYVEYKNLNVSKNLQFLLYRIQLLHQSSYSYINYKLINAYDLFMRASDNKIIIFDSELNCISQISYLQCEVENTEYNSNYTSNNIIGKIITTIKIDDIYDHAYCVFELNFDLIKNKTRQSIRKQSKSISIQENIAKTNILRESIADYLSKIHTISDSVNILQCLSTKNDTNTDNSMLSARTNLGGTHKPRQYVADTTGFYNKDVSGYIYKKGKTTCYEKYNEKTGNNSNYCTYDGLLNYYRSELSDNSCDIINEFEMFNQFKDFFSSFHNISSSLIIVTDLTTINKFFEYIPKSKSKTTYKPKGKSHSEKKTKNKTQFQSKKKSIITSLTSNLKSKNNKPLINNIHSLGESFSRSSDDDDEDSDEDNDIGLTQSLEFILFTNTESFLYNIKGDKYIETNITHKYKLKNDIDIKSYQNVYIIVQCDYERTDTDIYDPPVFINELNKMQLFIVQFKKIYKSSMPVIVTSYLSRAILTSSLINLALHDIRQLGLVNDNNNTSSTLQIFMLIYFIRHLKLGKSNNDLLISSIDTTKIGKLDISNNSLQNVIKYILNHHNIYDTHNNIKSPNEIINDYIANYIKPIDYEKVFIGNLLTAIPSFIKLEGGNKNKLNKSRLTKNKLNKSRLTKTKSK